MAARTTTTEVVLAAIAFTSAAATVAFTPTVASVAASARFTSAAVAAVAAATTTAAAVALALTTHAFPTGSALASPTLGLSHVWGCGRGGARPTRAGDVLERPRPPVMTNTDGMIAQAAAAARSTTCIVIGLNYY